MTTESPDRIARLEDEWAKTLEDLRRHGQITERFARLEGEIKAMEARNEAMKSDVNASLALLREDLAKRDMDAARRDRDNTRWAIGLAVAVVIVMSIIVRWPSGVG